MEQDIFAVLIRLAHVEERRGKKKRPTSLIRSGPSMAEPQPWM
jgi:hypothetical protein